jgi:hypothetical protein
VWLKESNFYFRIGPPLRVDLWFACPTFLVRILQNLVSAKAPEVLVLSTSLLVWGLLFGSVGLGFFVYGRKQKVVVPLICGLVLMVFPYFISNTILLVAIGVTLIVLPYFVRI